MSPRGLRRFFVLLLLLAAGAEAFAEVAALVDSSGRVMGTLEMIERGTNPWRIWSPVRTGVADSPELLNVLGDYYLDGLPSIVINPVSGLPEAVWSYWDGNDYEIAWSRFENGTWHRVPGAGGLDYQLITQDDLHDLDPRLWIDEAGNRRIAWWRSGAAVDDVVLTVLPAGESQWWTPERLSAEGIHTRRPDLRTTPYGTFIAAEEYAGSPQQILIVVFENLSLIGVAPQRESEPWGRIPLRSEPYADSLGVSIIGTSTSWGAVPAITWRDGAELGVAVFDPQSSVWAQPYYIPYVPW